jgi:acyl-coenzyme A synthetase/AMP-(fatty) acid ligase
MAGSLSVGKTNLTSDQVEIEIIRLSKILSRVADSKSHGEFAPILVDFSIGSHLLLAALSRLSMNCALIDSSLPIKQIKLQLSQLQSKVIYFLPDTKRKRMPLFSGIRFRNLETFGKRGVDRVSQKSGASVVLFSSGSTGEPKGVVFEWKSIHKIVESRYSKDFQQGLSPSVLNISPLNWTVGLFHAISLNNNVNLISRNPLSMTMNQLIEEIRRTKVDRIYFGANFARVFAKAVEHNKGPTIETVKVFVIGSGAISWDLVNKFKTIISSEAEFVHSFGSTEAVGMLASSWEMGKIPASGRVSLGHLEEADGIRLRDTGEKDVFEVLATQRTAQRYLSEDLTTQHFITLPDGTRCWRSGDLIRLEGQPQEIFYEGRVDDIVKNSDHLVSLAALEREINSLRGVELSAVKKFLLPNRDLIVAFVQMSNPNPKSETEILSALRKRLPSYSIPHRVILCDEIPLTNRGKADLEKLRSIYLGQE